MDNGIMENFFARLKVEMYYGEKFEFPREFIKKLEEYIHYYNHERISLKRKGMSPVQFRAHSHTFQFLSKLWGALQFRGVFLLSLFHIVLYPITRS